MSFTLKGIELEDPKYCEECPLCEYDGYTETRECKITWDRLKEEKVNCPTCDGGNRDFWYCLRPENCSLIEEKP
jgi:hypothetical protein